MNRILAALIALTFAACGPDLESSGADALKTTSSKTGSKKKGSTTATATTFAARTTANHQSGVDPVWSNAFVIDQTYDVFFATEITGTFSGHHTVSFEYRMPDGTVYQRAEVPFATDAAAYPGEQQAEMWSGGYRVWASLPVAGTMIQQYGMTGLWTVAVYVDGAATATASATFGLQ